MPNLSYYYPPILDLINSPTTEKIRVASHKICIHNIPIAHIVYDFINHDPKNYSKYLTHGANIDHMYVINNSYLRPIYIEYLLHTFLDKINI